MKKTISAWVRCYILPYVGYFVIKAVFGTIRMKILNDTFIHESIKADKAVIYGLWHNRLAYTLYGYTHFLRRTNLITLISRSKDGRVLGKIAELFGVTVTYGSSSRGGSVALREMIKLAKAKNMDCGITPDGPRGPKYEVQPGIISVAQSTGIPIIPVMYDVTRKIRLKSWDGFYVPMPFSRGVVIFGDPIYVPKELSDDQRSYYMQLLKQSLMEICDKGKELLSLNTNN